MSVAGVGVHATAIVLGLLGGWEAIGIALGSGSAHTNVGGATAVLLISVNRESEYRLSSASGGVLFDVDATGVSRHVAWPTNGSDVAFLAIDKDGDGRITSGKELISSRTTLDTLNCFRVLQRLAMETNGGVTRGSVTSDDPLFSQLLLWYDANRDGISQASELKPAAEVVTAIGVGYEPMEHTDDNGSRFRTRGWVHVRTAPGRNQVDSPEENRRRTRRVWEVVLASE